MNGIWILIIVAAFYAAYIIRRAEEGEKAIHLRAEDCAGNHGRTNKNH